MTGEVPESISEATLAANSQALQSDEAEKTAAKQTSESDRRRSRFLSHIIFSREEM